MQASARLAARPNWLAKRTAAYQRLALAAATEPEPGGAQQGC
jgi:hypothetical protein